MPACLFLMPMMQPRSVPGEMRGIPMRGANLETLNLNDVITRIERAQAETRNFVAEQGKLSAVAD